MKIKCPVLTLINANIEKNYLQNLWIKNLSRLSFPPFLSRAFQVVKTSKNPLKESKFRVINHKIIYFFKLKKSKVHFIKNTIKIDENVAIHFCITHSLNFNYSTLFFTQFHGLGSAVILRNIKFSNKFWFLTTFFNISFLSQREKMTTCFTSLRFILMRSCQILNF